MATTIKPRKDEQVFFANISLAACVCHKLVIPAFQQGKLFVHVYGRQGKLDK